MSIYKLTYFNGRARAELTRLIFNAAGVNFIDERISYAKWKESEKKSIRKIFKKQTFKKLLINSK